MITEYRIRHLMGAVQYPTLEAAEAAAEKWRKVANPILVESRQCTPWREIGPPDPRPGDLVVIAGHHHFGGRTGTFVEAVLKSAGGAAHRVYWRVRLDPAGRHRVRLDPAGRNKGLVHDFVPEFVAPVREDG
jgi:hypothetical protein